MLTTAGEAFFTIGTTGDKAAALEAACAESPPEDPKIRRTARTNPVQRLHLNPKLHMIRKHLRKNMVHVFIGNKNILGPEPESFMQFSTDENIRKNQDPPGEQKVFLGGIKRKVFFEH